MRRQFASLRGGPTGDPDAGPIDGAHGDGHCVGDSDAEPVGNFDPFDCNQIGCRGAHPSVSRTLSVAFCRAPLDSELDGSQLTMQETDSQEALQTAYLPEQGYQVKRFWNE